MDRKVNRKKFEEFLNTIEPTVFVPLEENGMTFFREWKGEEINYSYDNAMIPPKEVFLPQAQSLFEYRVEEGISLTLRESKKDRAIIFGIRPCDADSLALLDEIFLEDEVDTLYSERRKNTLLLGLACEEPLLNCFCTSAGGSPSSKKNLDALITRLDEDHFYLETSSEEGEDLISANDDLFDSPSKGERKKKEEIQTAAKEIISREIDFDRIPPKLEESWEHPIWEEACKRCIECGICTYFCPTCYCFNLKDVTYPDRVERVRVWDSCQFPLQSLQTSGHNPRGEKKERFRQRIYHKFKYFHDNYGKYACVGCGRCLDRCPVNIDFIHILKEMEEQT